MFAAYCTGIADSDHPEGDRNEEGPSKKEEELDWLENQSAPPVYHRPVVTKNESDNSDDEINFNKTKERDVDRKKKHKKRYSSSDEERYRNKSKSRRRDDNKKQTPSKEIKHTSIFVHELKIRQAKPFCIDKIPDNNNKCFTSLNFIDIAQYHRMKFCLGKCKFPLFTDDNISRNKRKKGKGHREEHRYYSGDNMEIFKQSRVKLSTPQIKLSSKTTIEDDILQSHDEYVSLDWSMSEIISNPELEKFINPLGIYDSKTQSYLLNEKITATETEGATDSVNVDENRLRNRTEFFNRHLRENPTDVETWLKFVDFQEESGGESLRKRISNISKISRTIVDKKISILEKSIEANPKNIDLRIKLLFISADILGSDSLKKEWDNLVFVRPNNIKLWRQYMRFVRSQYSIFTVSGVITCFNKCMKILTGLLRGTFLTHEAPTNLQHDMLELIVDHCHFLKHVGHSEKATATLQALIEFNLYQPSDLISTPYQDKVDNFELFWESNGPLIGCDDAAGWASYEDSNISQTETADLEPDIADVDTNVSQHMNWLRIEQMREGKDWLPFRSKTSDDSCEDPDRVVLFDDIAPCLISFSEQDVRHQLIQSFLSYLNNDPISISRSTNTKIHPIHLERNEYKDTTHYHLSEIWSLPILPTRFQKSTSISQNILTGIQKIVTPDFRTGMNLQRMNQTIENVRLSNSVAVESKSTLVKENRSAAKKILKSNRTDLLLWSLYAEFEFSAGNILEAERILDTTLSMNKDKFKFRHSSELGSDLLHLVRTYILHQLKTNLQLKSTSQGSSQDFSDSKILFILHCLSGVVEFSSTFDNDRNKSPASLLKTKVYLRSELSNILDEVSKICIDREDVRISEFFSFLRDYCLFCCLFLFITTGNFTTSIDTIDQITQKIISITKPTTNLTLDKDNSTPDPERLELTHPLNLTLEKIYEDFVFLIHFGMSLKPLSNKPLKLFVRNATKMFPCNCQLLAEMMQLELDTILSCDMRRFLENSLTFSTDSCLPAVVYGTSSELARLNLNLLRDEGSGNSTVEIPTCGITHRLRSVFERVLRFDTQRDCLLLWRLYLYFEAKQGSEKTADVVFYRAIQQCPWAKVLYMDAISYFPEKLQIIVDMMTEKEIRIRFPLEELEMLWE